MLDYAKARNRQSADVRRTYAARDAMLHALGVGIGQHPLDREPLRYVTEAGLRILPSMAWPPMARPAMAW